MEPQENSAQSIGGNPDRWAGLGIRVFTGIVLGIIAFICVWQGGVLFSAFILLLALLMKKEWDSLVVNPTPILRVGGYIYIIMPCASLLWLRNIPGETGIAATVALIAIISATDIGAYLVGKRMGKRKLSPVISPGKTWEGLLGGIGVAFITGLLISPEVPIPHTLLSAAWIGPFIAVIAQAGDLFESALKRQANVKDSGTLLPGHGGLLDRFDGYMFAAPIFAAIIHKVL